MKYIIFTFFILLNSLIAMADIACDGEKILIKRGARPSQWYQEGSIQITDPELTRFLPSPNQLNGTIWDNEEGLNSALFSTSSDIFIHLYKSSKIKEQKFSVIFSINKKSKSECLKWEEVCDCCYYGDCSPRCLEEVSTPGITYFEKTFTCEEKKRNL